MKFMCENMTGLPSLRNQDWKTVSEETGKKNELLTHISTKNITELKEQINAGVKLVCEKVGFDYKT